MAETWKKLYQGTLPAASNQLLYTVPGATTAIIKHIRIVNYSAATQAVQMWHDGTADSNRILPSVSIEAGGWGEFEGTILMEASDTLYARTESASAVTVTVYGLEIS